MPAAKPGPRELARRVVGGDQAALSRALSCVSNESPGHDVLARILFAHHGRSHKIGFCGAPGSGKSSLLNRLITGFRKAGETVGVLAVDPTSPFTGGAFLGDRIRVQEHALDDGVFMRSLATRGTMGGLNDTIFGAIHVMEAFGAECAPLLKNKRKVRPRSNPSAPRGGFDRILIETVGTGQDEVDIYDAADTVVCVHAPYQGDEFQAMKAGTMEIADIFAVNKADLEEVGKTVAALRDALSLGPRQEEGAWQPKVIAVSAMTGLGVDELRGLLDEHPKHLKAAGEGERRRRIQLKRELSLWISKRIFEDTARRISERHIEMLLEKKSDPQTLGRKLIKGKG